MKKYLLAIVLLSAVVLASGCINSGNQTNGTGNNNTKTYSGDGFTFQYPKDWETIASQGRDSVVAVGDPNSASNGTAKVNVVVQRVPKPQNMQLKDYYNTTYTQFASQNMSYIPISEGTIIVNGISGLENVYKINSGGLKEQRAVWFLNNNRIYIILCTAPVSDYNSQLTDFDTIVNSFKFT